MSKETYQGEAFLHSLFKHFATFNFDKAKEQADKEKDANRNTGSVLWVNLLLSISQLAAVEKLYMNLTFLTPKGFLRKESSVRLTYETILTELAELEKRSSYGPHLNSPESHSFTSSSGNWEKISTGVLLHIRTHLIFFIQARLLMLSFYEKLISSSSGDRVVDYAEMLDYITEIIQKNSNSFHHPVLTPIKTTFTYECDIMRNFLGSLKTMQEWQFLTSLLHLNDAHTKLSLWLNMVQSRESKKYTFSSSFLKSSPLPALFQWLSNAKAAFVAKFSLYFYDTLAAQTPSQEMKNLLAKQSIDYVSKIQNFMRKADAQYLCLVLEAEGLASMKGPGYRHPSEDVDPLTGLNSFICISSFPSKPEKHWPSIIMRLSNSKAETGVGADKVIAFYDSQFDTIYFFGSIEHRITLVTIFESKKSDKECSLVRDFLYSLIVQIRCTRVFAALHQA